MEIYFLQKLRTPNRNHCPSYEEVIWGKTVLLNSRESFCVISVLSKMLTFIFKINKTSSLLMDWWEVNGIESPSSSFSALDFYLPFSSSDYIWRLVGELISEVTLKILRSLFVNQKCFPGRCHVLHFSSQISWVMQIIKPLVLETISVEVTVVLCFLAGVADGVGGWRDYGVDPSQFSGTLMRTCERLVKEGRFVPSNPVGILTAGYCELLQNKVPLLGKTPKICQFNLGCVLHMGLLRVLESLVIVCSKSAGS